MKIYYIDRKTQIRHFHDLSVLKGKNPISTLTLSIPQTETFALQLVLLPEEEQVLKRVVCQGTLSITCLNSHITDKFGHSYEKEIPLEKGVLQPLFFLLPAGQAPCFASRTAKILFNTDIGTQQLELMINYTGEAVKNSGYDDLWRLSRLNWLNSNRFLDKKPVAPYIAPVLQDNTVKILGREVVFGENGLPAQITSFFDESVLLCETPQLSLLRSPMEFQCAGETFQYHATQFAQEDGVLSLFTKGQSARLQIAVHGSLSYEGCINYSIQLTAKENLTVENICLFTALSAESALYMNGLGKKGGKTEKHLFHWDEKKHQDCLFLGAVNGGLRLKWKAEHYRKPLVNIYYRNLPLCVPSETWDNHGDGAIMIQEEKETVAVCADTHAFTMAAGEQRAFDFEVHITPFKPVDYQKHYAVRYSHNNKLKNEYREVDRAAKLGLNNVVIHHGNMVHPFINYPFLETDRLKKLVDYAAQKGIGVKVYYTTREHSNHMAEVFAYKALGDEIILRKKGEGYVWPGGTAKWLTDYFGDAVIPAWKVEYKWGKYKGDPDVSFIVRPNSRLDNYYIEGLDWLVKNIGIKGIYIDDTALDRTTIERARKVLSQNNGLIDMHMWNHEEERAGDVSCMNLYTELFPFLDSLWIGEGYPYSKLSPDYLLTEVSGLPYGQTSQMLENGGNPYIGMLYAMNNRYGWGTKTAPRIYRLWDDFGIQDSEMRGYWHSKNPVCTGNAQVLATVYLKKDKALVCLFNFSEKEETFTLNCNASFLGFSPNTCQRVPIRFLQKEKSISLTAPMKLGPKKGVILLLKQ